MQNNDFCQNLNSLFSIRAPELRFDEDEVLHGFVVDDNERRINTFPILHYEERYLSVNDSESYTYISICSFGECMNTVKIRSSELFTERAFVSKYGNKPFASFDNNSWEIFFTVIQVMLPEIEQHVLYSYSGWSKELDSYLFGNLLVDINNIKPVKSTLIKTETLLSEKSGVNVCKNIDNIVAHISDKPIVGYICILYLMLSHCKQRFVILYRIAPEFVLNLVGGTGSYKTSTVSASFNTNDGSVSSFEDSLASIRRAFQACKSGVTIVDDYKTSNSSNDAKFEKIVRLSGDIQTTGKYVSGNKVIDEMITGMSVITGEVRPKLQQSSYSRILFVDLEQNPINLNWLTELQQSKEDLNSVIVLFVQYILQNESFDADCIASFQKHRDELLQDSKYKSMHGRYYSIYAWLAAMWDVYTNFLQFQGVSTNFDFKSELKDYIYSQHCMYNNDPIRLFKTAYMKLVDANEIIITDKNGTDSLNFDVVSFDGELFLKSNGAFKKIQKYWQDKGIDFSISERKLRLLLHDAGLLKKKNGKFTDEKKNKDNRSYSGYYLYKNYFLNYGGTDDEEF